MCVGVTNYVANNALSGFKSYGNPTNGDMFVLKYSAAHLASTTAPASPQWYKTYSQFVSGKGIRELPAGGYIIGAHSNPVYNETTSQTEEFAMLVMLDANGNMRWSKQYKPHGEVADIALLTDGSFALTGHKVITKYNADGTVSSAGYDGVVTKFTSNGTFIWQTIVGNPVGGIHQFGNRTDAGNPTLIYGTTKALSMCRFPCFRVMSCRAMSCDASFIQPALIPRFASYRLSLHANQCLRR